jgi:rfaE bifunctional protein nucleotidyltransferase chain/domain
LLFNYLLRRVAIFLQILRYSQDCLKWRVLNNARCRDGSATLWSLHGVLPPGKGEGNGGAILVCGDDPPLAFPASAVSGGDVRGCFDLLHRGHVSQLANARRLGDCLIVCLNSDASARRLKGNARPLVHAEDRMAVLSALASVDAVVVFEEDTPAEVLRRIRPHLWVKGGDYAVAGMPERAVVEDGGGEVVLVPYVDGRSSTELIERAAAAYGSAGAPDV